MNRSPVIWVLFATVLIAGASAVALHFTLPGGLPSLLKPGSAGEPYACPMVEDAEVRSNGPGKCPKCGMDLVPLSQTEHGGTAEAASVHPGRAEAPSGHAGHGGTEPANSGGPPASGVKGEAGKKVAAPAGKGKPLYYCPMHPKFQSDRPGDCQICGMKLVQQKGGTAPESGVEGMAVVTIRPEQVQLIGVQTGPVEKKPMRRTIRAVGRVDYNERGLSAVNLKFGGWVERLHVNATGQPVKVGDPLLSVYSPELLEAQRSFLLALESSRPSGQGAAGAASPAMEQGQKSARMRLLLWGLTEEQLRELEARKEPETAVTIFSRSAGVVVKRNVVAGSYLEPGKDLYELADLSSVWIQADVYESEIPLVTVGQEAKIHLSSLPGEFLTGKVVFIYPFLNEGTRTVRVRVETPNPDGRLKPAMYADVAIAVDLGEQLVVDDQAILDSGTRQIIFVDRGEGRFDPREVKIGTRSDGLAVVLEGLKEGERVVTSGNFLIDSESKLKAALSQGASGTHQH